MTPSSPEPDASPPTRWGLFLSGFADLLLCGLLASVTLGGFAIREYSNERTLVPREDRWRFQSMPSNEDALLVWSSSQPDLRNFHVQRVQADQQLVLRYERSRAKGPAHPDWARLGYRMAYLVSAPSLPTSTGTPPFPWGGLMVAFLVVGGVAVFRISRGRRAGVRLMSPTGRPQHGWLRWLLLASIMLLASAVAQDWLLRILHLDQEVLQPEFQALRHMSGWTLWIAAAGVVLVGPVAEELLFRGCIFGRFQAYGYAVTGAIVSAVLFSVGHGVAALLPFFFLWGIILAWLCHRTRSLWPSMALHCLNNGVALIGIFYAKA